MKARVKGTTAIIDVTFDVQALNEGYPPYKAGGGVYYYPEQLIWIDITDNAEPDYWEKLKHQYAGMAMQGILANPETVALYDVDVAATAIRIANITIEKLKEESQCEK